MKYNKTIILIIVLLSLFSTWCFMAAYQVTQDARMVGVRPMVNQDIKNGLKSRFEAMGQYSELNNKASFAFNDSFEFPPREYFDNFEEKLDSLFNKSREEMYEVNSKAIRASSFMVENTDKTFKVSAIMQNVTKEMLVVSVHRGFLTVTAQEKTKEVKNDNKNKSKSAMVQQYASIKKVIKLPRNIDVHKAIVNFKENLLVIEFLKTELKEDNPIILEIK